MIINQIIDKVGKNDPGADTGLLESAYEFARRIHGNQKRETGEPFIEHSMHTAFILAQIKADVYTVAAGILHDTLEDSNYSENDLEKKGLEDYSSSILKNLL